MKIGRGERNPSPGLKPRGVRILRKEEEEEVAWEESFKNSLSLTLTL